jgi:methylated-DNA-[protein]-cysteine S-methyltransferase
MSASPARGFQAVARLPCAAVGIRTRGAVLEELVLLPADTPEQPAEAPCAALAVEDLRAYLAAPGHRFRVPIRPHGTPFQLRVWEALGRLRAGETVSYGRLAERLGSGPRAVAAACRANRLPLRIPCHRVVAAHGPGGYAGATAGWRLAIKRWLLDHEREG